MVRNSKLKWRRYSNAYRYFLWKGTVITHADAFRVNNSFTGNVNPITNFERVDTDNFNRIGEWNESQQWNFFLPCYWNMTGTCIGSFYASSGYRSRYNGVEMLATTNNSSHGNCARFYCNLGTNYGTGYSSGICRHIFDVSNTSTHKIRFMTEVEYSGVGFDAGSSHSFKIFSIC